MSAVKVLPVQVLKLARVFAVVFALLMVYAAMPMPAHAAAGLTEQQIQAVSNLLASFNTDQAVVAKVSATLRGETGPGLQNKPQVSNNFLDRGEKGHATTSPTTNWPSTNAAGAAICGQLMRNIGRGTTGDDVAMLQNFLRNAGDLREASSTGFFGEATERALGQWQVRMGLAASGTPATTGFGFLGPKTREMLMRWCKENMGSQPGQTGQNNSSSTPFATDRNAGPLCILKANRDSVQPGTPVTLYWESKNATYSSTISGEKGPVQGSVIVNPQETTTYLKKVYDANGNMGQCTKMVEVKGTTPAAEKKIVVVPANLDLGHVFSMMGSGVAAVMDGYLSLFGLSLE